MNLAAANLPSGGTPITIFTPALFYGQVGIVPIQFGFSLSQYPDFAQYAALYDLYRITKVEVEFRPNFKLTNLLTTAATGTYQNTMGRVPWYAWVDTSASTAGVTTTSFQQVNNLHKWYYDETYKMHFWPKPSQNLNGTDNAGPEQTDTWIDCNLNSVTHYGLWVQPGYLQGAPAKNATDTTKVDMWVRMHVEFKFNE